MGQSVAGQAISMLMLSASLAPTIGRYLGCRALWAALVLPPAIAMCLLIVGWAMDRWGWAQRVDVQSRVRSGTWGECFERLGRIEALVARVVDMPRGKG